jgi:hypothetical protein
MHLAMFYLIGFYFSDFGFDWAQKRAGDKEEMFFYIKTISCIFVCLKNKHFKQRLKVNCFFANVSRIFQSSLKKVSFLKFIGI